MPTLLSDILDPVALDQQVADGYIRVQRHPTLPLRIYKYAEKAVYEQKWTLEARVCRGLIVGDDDEIVARPWSKFWSLGQHETLGTAKQIPWDEPFHLYEKVDGSCGVLHPVPGGHAIATLGSFASEQAIHATKVWKERYEEYCCIPSEQRWTFIFEVVYRANRIVLDYGDTDDLVLLGAVNIDTGQSISPRVAKNRLMWPGPIACEMSPDRYHRMEQEDSESEEGFVLHFPKSDFRLKAKYATYLRLHRLMTGTSSKTIWRCMAEGREHELAELPDELHPFATQMVDSLKRDYSLIDAEARRLAWIVMPMESRKEQAKYVLSHAAGRTVAGATFALLDGADPSVSIWKAIEPEYTAPFGNIESE